MPSLTSNILTFSLLLLMLLACPLQIVRAQSACTFADDGTPSGPGLCNCFESRDPRGWIVECIDKSLTSVPSGIPSEAVYLSLNTNSLTSLPSDAFQELTSLQNLYIRSNGLQSDQIASGTFTVLTNLTTLDLSDNQIQLSRSMIAHLLPLQMLNILTLTGNNINTIDSSAVTVFDRLDLLDLTSNLFACDCQLAWFRNWLYNNELSLSQIMGTVCSSPAEYRRLEMTQAGFCPSSLCYTCIGGSDRECNYAVNALRTCSSSQSACQNEIRVSNGIYTINKMCKQLQACRNNVANNLDECNTGSVNSVCRTCCQGDLCNGPASGVTENYTLPEFPVDPHLRSQMTTVATTLRPRNTSDTTLTPTFSQSSPLSPVATIATNETPETTTVASTCPEDTSSSTTGTIIWHETVGGEVVKTRCPYTYSTRPPAAATRNCSIQRSGLAVWDDPDVQLCPTAYVILQELSEVSITKDNAETVSTNLTVATDTPTSLTEQDVSLAVDTLQHLVESLSEYVNDSVDVLRNVLETVNHLADVPTSALVAGQQSANTSTRILRIIDVFALNVEFDADVLEENSGKVDVVVMKVKNSNIAGISFRSMRDKNGNSNPELIFNQTNLKQTDEVQASMELPATLVQSLNNLVDRVQFVVYKDVIFFEVVTAASAIQPTTATSTSTTNGIIDKGAVNSLVISASVGNLRISGLSEPIKNTFVHQRPERAGNPSCVFWDFNATEGQGSWSNEGCRVATTLEGTTVCECDHLTNFALLMDIYGTSSNINEDHVKALSIVTYIGCGMSIIGLTITFISYIMIRNKKGANQKRQLRSDRRTRVLLNLVVALLLMNVLFVTDAIVVEFGEPGEIACTLLGALLHFGLLAAVMWMGLEAWHMYLALVRIFDSYTTHFMQKLCAIGWGVPVVIVGITLGVNLDHYDYYNNFCWLRIGDIPFYVAFLVPAFAMLFFNSVIFALVTNQLCNLRRRTISTTDRFNAAAQLRASFSITVLLGLTWGIAIFMIGEASLVFSYLFAILNSFQGFIIFVFHCVLNEEVRTGWRHLFCPQCLTLEELQKNSSGQHFSSSKQVQIQKRMTIEYQIPNSNGHTPESLSFHQELPKFNPFTIRPESSYQESDSKI